mgnify:CR=1 FL=1
MQPRGWIRYGPQMRLITLLLLTFTAGVAVAKGNPWSRFKAPIGTAESIGSYSKGCLLGGVALPETAAGLETIRRYRKRFFGHPVLTDFLLAYGQKIKEAGLGVVLLGDLSQVRGGPMPSGHRSHQMGLDADVWFTTPPAAKRCKDGAFTSLVTKNEKIDKRVFTARHVKLLRTAAKSPAVARIFVGWVIKRELCRVVEGDRAWLGKIRPWWGHTRHFHVRLHCPPGGPDCRNQGAVPTGDGCGKEVWFSKAAVAKRKKKKTKKKKKKPYTPLPSRCLELIK